MSEQLQIDTLSSKKIQKKLREIKILKEKQYYLNYFENDYKKCYKFINLPLRIRKKLIKQPGWKKKEYMGMVLPGLIRKYKLNKEELDKINMEPYYHSSLKSYYKIVFENIPIEIKLYIHSYLDTDARIALLSCQYSPDFIYDKLTNLDKTEANHKKIYASFKYLQPIIKYFTPKKFSEANCIIPSHNSFYNNGTEYQNENPISFLRIHNDIKNSRVDDVMFSANYMTIIYDISERPIYNKINGRYIKCYENAYRYKRNELINIITTLTENITELFTMFYNDVIDDDKYDDIIYSLLKFYIYILII